MMNVLIPGGHIFGIPRHNTYDPYPEFQIYSPSAIHPVVADGLHTQTLNYLRLPAIGRPTLVGTYSYT